MMIQGNMWGVARNEDGDDSGWGSRTFFADKADLSSWQFVSPESDPWIYESPKMFRHGSELYLVARTDPGGPFWSKDNPLLNVLPAWQHHLADLVSFSLRGHGTAIWRLDTVSGGLEMVLELAGCGDTAFPSIVRSQLSYTNIYFLMHSFPNIICHFLNQIGQRIVQKEYRWWSCQECHHLHIYHSPNRRMS